MLDNIRHALFGGNSRSYTVRDTTFTAGFDKNGVGSCKYHKNVRAYEVACAIFAATAVGFTVLAPFTAAVLFVPALVCAVAAIGLGIYVIKVKYGAEIVKEAESVVSDYSAASEKSKKAERKAAQDAADEARAAQSSSSRAKYAATAATIRERNEARKAAAKSK